MPIPPSQPPSDLASLDLGTLAFIAGTGFNHTVTARLRAAGYPEVRQAFGYVVQHLLSGPKSATQLANLMGISQQAATKRLQEMLGLGLLEEVAGEDARRRMVVLSARGWSMVETTRALREQVAAEVLASLPPAEVGVARRVLAEVVHRLGIEPAVRARRLREAD
ncbi:MarR family winged helix-turn-helix transcriptional regulator [Massilia sp. IC2-477]|uniref:MarR family winged helix-turn-helix transcriptional regulator n=1 Tax=unclassified Massilia TaxID=2609279 RepID=UPI001D115405|nr:MULTISPECIES: MarR family winged helix-turn-helix transcriptional regulator [unclassified Massilia]MCC2956641.1 MarR family winged helix-turn-helix transcriptional regulator [Massilia sp. IC2-477]MCC2971220.1 MarR family winged helix-turn-helix transcriptional regulator [Massilia sp. IC2-476]